MRINKYIADSGLCSRRQADRLVEQGDVTINSVKASPGDRVMPGDTVLVDGKPLKKRDDTVWIALNKPEGIECSADSSVRNVIDYVSYPSRIFYVGRLDKDSRGLLLLTNDGDTADRIARARYGHEKEYLVTLDRPYGPGFVNRMEHGVVILDGIKTRHCRVSPVDEKTFSIIITQGLNRQIRRMCEALGYRVKRLERTRVMNITLDGIEYGKWRELTAAEVEELTKTADRKAGGKNG
ncbi:MAG: pseudouridine synthase [Lachnospiraceae bacterium]|nr:pseudouridine synthase [Lachnospiraceae bacterium]